MIGRLQKTSVMSPLGLRIERITAKQFARFIPSESILRECLKSRLTFLARLDMFHDLLLRFLQSIPQQSAQSFVVVVKSCDHRSILLLDCVF